MQYANQWALEVVWFTLYILHLCQIHIDIESFSETKQRSTIPKMSDYSFKLIIYTDQLQH